MTSTIEYRPLNREADADEYSEDACDSPNAYEEYVEMRMRIVELETENRSLKSQVEAQKALLLSLQDAVMQATMRSVPEIISTSESLLNTAVIRGEDEVVSLLLQSEEHRTPTSLDTALQTACQHRRADIAELLIENGANVHADHECALVWACHANDARIVRLLLKNGANPEALHGLPMRIAVGSGNIEIVRALAVTSNNPQLGVGSPP